MRILLVVLAAAGLAGCLSPEQKAAYSQYIQQHPEAAPVYHPITVPQLRTAAPAQPSHSLNCTTSFVGDYAYTSCN